MLQSLAMQDLDINALPDDPVHLKALLSDTISRLADRENELRLLREQLNLALHRRFGKSSEKNPGQHELFDEPEQLVELEADAIDDGEDDNLEPSLRLRVAIDLLPYRYPRRKTVDLAIEDRPAAHSISEIMDQHLSF